MYFSTHLLKSEDKSKNIQKKIQFCHQRKLKENLRNKKVLRQKVWKEGKIKLKWKTYIYGIFKQLKKDYYTH